MACTKHWILDGYNVMHALNFVRPDLPFEIARERFTSWVGQFQALGDKVVTIVFDDNVHMECYQEVHPRVRTVYSPPGFNGDGAVLNIIRQTTPSMRPYCCVVTRDLMLRDAILALKAMVISPSAFADEFKAYRSHVDKRHTKNTTDFYRPFKLLFDQVNVNEKQNATD